MRVAVLGAGHAGVKAAETLAGKGVEVTLYSGEEALPYYRPRLIALAFGQAELADILMHEQGWYAGQGIDLRLGERVGAFDAARRCVVGTSGSEAFDEVIVALGAGPFLPPPFCGSFDCAGPLWTLRDAERVRARVREGMHLAVAGGGILGIETALRARERGLRVTVFERLPRLMPVQFGPTASVHLADVLREMGIEVLTDCSLRELLPRDGGGLVVQTEKGERVEADEALFSVGARRHVQLAQEAGLCVERGVLVDTFLRTSHEHVWAAGDIIEMPGLNRCSAVDATMQGRIAGLNAQAVASREAWVSYEPSHAAVHLKFKDFELHAAGRVAAEGDREEVVEHEASRCRIRVTDARGGLVGLQMIGTAEHFQQWAKDLS